MATIGEVNSKIKSEIKSENEIEWKIYNFSSLSDEISVCYSSPTFLFCKESWYLKIFPNGNEISSKGYISLFLYKESCGSPIKVKYTLGLKTLSGQKVLENYCKKTFTKAEEGYGWSKLFLRSQALEIDADVFSIDAITVFCSLKFPTSVETPIKEDSNEKCSLCEKLVDADNLSLHQRQDKPVKCPDCSAGFILENWCDHECQAQKMDCEPICELTSEKLSDDFKAIMLSGDHSDTVVKINTEEFRLHRSILAARNSYFDSMFKSDMKEKSTGIITIQDCEPSIFRSFINFVYCGKVDKLSPENVCELYTVADKYQEDQLKKECLNFMLNTMPVNNFCDYFILAFTHHERELLQKCAELFQTNGKEIVRSVKWQTLLKEYPIQANELFIKAFDYFVE